MDKRRVVRREGEEEEDSNTPPPPPPPPAAAADGADGDEALGAVGGVPLPPPRPDAVATGAANPDVAAAMRRRPGGHFENGFYVAPAAVVEPLFPELALPRSMEEIQRRVSTVERLGIPPEHRRAFRLAKNPYAGGYLSAFEREWTRACRVSSYFFLFFLS